MLAELAAGAPRWTMVGGKGGVGKTTVAAALAVALADAGHDVLALSVDPAHSLGDALGAVLSPEAQPVAGVPRLHAAELDAARERAGWLAEHRDALLALLDRGTYLERGEAEGLVELALPGSDELAALLRLAVLARDDGPERLVLDTAPTGHTLRLLALPRLAGEWTAALERLEARPRAVARAFGATTLPEDDAVRRLLTTLRDDVARVAARLGDAGHTRVVLVTTSEPAVEAETRRYADALGPLGVALGAIVVNRVSGDGDAARRKWTALGVPIVPIPELPHDPRGAEALRALAGAGVGPTAGGAPAAAAPGARLCIGEAYAPPSDRGLYVVAGKGGVGKSTVASALALRLAEPEDARVLLLSVDPAGSLSDIWGVRVGTTAVVAPDAPRLALRQVEAETEWASLREQYREGAGRLAGALTGGEGGGAGAADRRLAEQLVELAPPGLDELVALVELVDLASPGVYTAVVLDTAPTGHLLRLLEIPELALQWAHMVLRLLLRYREVVGLGKLAERVLRFARDVRRLDERLRDRAATMVVAVARPEALSVAETARLLVRLRELGMPVDLLFVNRLLAGHGTVGPVPVAADELAVRLLALPAAPPAVAGPALRDGPLGAAALQRFARSWRRITLDDAFSEAS
ncbi:MAG TPA: ArsA family ATPase [Gemmatimonadaceae bacterium]|nr:ArsA family ATPase [Gemmatimonadaceae bacterium]